ncbi:hypothetical protein ABPG75_004392 [Micractinium tetrahymenae]
MSLRLAAASAALLVLFTAGAGATTTGCGSVDTIQVAIDCIGVATGGCDSECKAGLDAMKAQGTACEDNFKAEPGHEDYDLWVQACYNPNTDQCVESSKGQAFVDCLDVDVGQGYCPEKCRAAIAVTGLASDARCRELVKAYVDGDLGGD